METVQAQAAFLACGLSSLGLIFMIIGAIQLFPAMRSSRWPSAAGKILTAQIVPTSEGSHFLPHILYTYTVDGKEYSGMRVSFGELTSLARTEVKMAEETIRRYSPGKEVAVYFDPAAPDRCVLETGVGLSAYFPFGAGGLFFVLGLIFSLGLFI